MNLEKAQRFNLARGALQRLRARFERHEFAQKMAVGAFWVLLGTVASRGLTLLAGVIIARVLGKTGFGELAMLQSTVAMLGAVAGFGLGLTATKHVAEFRGSDPQRAGRVLALSGLVSLVTGGVMAIALLLLAPILAEQALGAPQLAGGLRIGAIVLFLTAISGAQAGALSGFEAFRTSAKINLSVGLASIPMLVIGVVLDGISGVMWASAVNLAFNWGLNHIALRKEARRHGVPVTWRGGWGERAILWNFSLPMSVSALILGPLNWCTNALLAHQPGGYGELGIYSVAIQWRAAVLFIPGILGQVCFPLLVQSGTGAPHKYRTMYKASIGVTAGAALVTMAPLIVLGHFIVQIYGPAFTHGSDVFRVMMFSAVFLAVNAAMGDAIIGRGRVWFVFIFNVISSLTLVFLSYLFVSRGYGAMGLALPTLIVYALCTIYLVVHTWRFLK